MVVHKKSHCFVSVRDAVSYKTDRVKYHFSSDIRNLLSPIYTPLCSLLHTLLKDECMCLQDE